MHVVGAWNAGEAELFLGGGDLVRQLEAIIEGKLMPWQGGGIASRVQGRMEGLGELEKEESMEHGRLRNVGLPVLELHGRTYDQYQATEVSKQWHSWTHIGERIAPIWCGDSISMGMKDHSGHGADRGVSSKQDVFLLASR